LEQRHGQRNVQGTKVTRRGGIGVDGGRNHSNGAPAIRSRSAAATTYNVYPGFGVEAVRRASPESRGLAMKAYTASLAMALGLASPAGADLGVVRPAPYAPSPVSGCKGRL
jgi:hypothetical protein